MLVLPLLLIALLTAILPYMVTRVAIYVPNTKLHTTYNWLPLLAAFLFIAAFFVPDIHISDQTSTFQQHFVGGGLYAACVYVYFKKLLGWRLSFTASVIVLFAWTSALGVANELLEFVLVQQLHLAHIGTGDTNWDLLANTLGAFAGYALLRVAKVEKLPSSKR